MCFYNQTNSLLLQHLFFNTSTMDNEMIAEERPIEDLLKEIDLLSKLELHKCQNCFTSLNKFTKIVARITSEAGQNQNKAWKIFCLPCFARWSPDDFDRQRLQPLNYKYIVCRRTDQAELQLDNWSIDEIYWLFHLTNSGYLDSDKLQKQFNKRTNSSRTQKELKNQMAELYSSLTSQKERKRLQSSNWKKQEQDPFGNNSNNIVKSLMQMPEKEQKMGRKFLEKINHEHLCEYVRGYPDNHENFKAKIMATNPDFMKRLDARNSKESYNERFSKQKQVELLTDQISRKDEKQKEISNFLTFMGQKYIRSYKRERSPAVDIKQDISQLLNLSHPEISKLTKVPGVKEEIKTITLLKSERSELLGEVRERKKMNLSNQSNKSKRGKIKIQGGTKSKGMHSRIEVEGDQSNQSEQN